jgi:predicted ATP-grasp superfamily ATP-dependent carboligase
MAVINVLITDGENRSALAVTRSLGRRGCTVFISGKDNANISSSSRYCKKAYTTPDPLTESKKYSQAIEEIILLEKIDVIFPMTEQSIYCLNSSRDQMGDKIILACVSPEKMNAVSNKYSLFQLAEKLGIDTPETLYIWDVDDFQRQKKQVSSFPVVVKPAFSKIQEGEKILSTGVLYAATPNDLNSLYETKPVLRYPSLIQEMITGEGTGLFSLFDHDRHLALFSHRRILEKPPSGGVSVLCQSVSLDNAMVEASRMLLSEVQWTGIAMVEFKRDIRDGKAKLMEINGRFWGSLQLAVSSGMDFPALCLDYYLGKKPTSLLSDYTVGRKQKWFFGMLDHLIIRLKKKHSLQNLPPKTPALWQVAKDLFSFSDENCSSDVYDAADLLPAITESKVYIKTLLKLKR